MPRLGMLETITIPMPRLGMLKVCTSLYFSLEERKQDPRSKHYTDAQFLEAEGLLKSLKWIDGSRLKKARPKKQSLYRCPDWGCCTSLQITIVDR